MEELDLISKGVIVNISSKVAIRTLVQPHRLDQLVKGHIFTPVNAVFLSDLYSFSYLNAS